MSQDIEDTADPRGGVSPAAAAPLAELKNPERGFSAMVVGKPHRAFYGNQYCLAIPLFDHYGVVAGALLSRDAQAMRCQPRSGACRRATHGWPRA
jgi:hypothetical protein